MLRPIASRVTPLPLEFELSPIVQQGTIERRYKRDSIIKGRAAATVDKLDSSPMTSSNVRSREKYVGQSYIGSTQASSGFGNLSEFTPVDLSTWIGGAYQISETYQRR